jgi:hypothetical protein
MLSPRQRKQFTGPELTTRQRKHRAGPKMIQFDLDQVRGFGRLEATNWEMAQVFGCSTFTIERARKQTASGFEAAYQKGQQETTTAIRTKLIERALKGNAFLLWKLAVNRLGYADSAEQVISIRQSQEAAGADPGKGDPVAQKMRPVAEWLAKERP